MSTSDSYVAFSRFGLGPRPGDLAAMRDPQAALAAELDDPAALLLTDPSLPDGIEALRQVRLFQQARKLAKSGNPPAPGGGDMAVPQAQIAANGRVTVPGVMSAQDLMNAEIAARLARVAAVPVGFGERLVAFWTNHFAVQAAANEVVRGLAGDFEREAIRPNALGRFHDLLLAATQHPAMLTSLNNATSIGPDSPAGKRTGKGLNENHARELMELHSVGVDAGYTQADVTSFAKVLTGWSFGANLVQPRQFGHFVFRAAAHEPGPQTVMGKLYAEPGVRQGEAVIADLARSPATAAHIAGQLARYFVADSPPAALVDRLKRRFLQTGGDLKAVALTLIEAPEAWSAPAAKLRSPQEFLWAGVRALGLSLKPGFVNRSLADLGQPLWNPPSPQGYKDDTATWLAPDAISTRVDTAQLMAAQARSSADPRQLADDLLGDRLSAETRTAIERAESRSQGLTLLLMSPEFQRR